ncbi:tyrosine-type recombinase/integrase [Halomicroarcula limicola]|uniref:Tyrosine-type recombinase/integrase n=1 Tax=Haloarcula limicola TaxID=1429915 RepID=A0A8J7Y9X4_9EURY|nr:tyrosine-type recombinase/integrase [Halomicroarcula limicola]MBV0924528.1 tyrosine-type recombinase/integrase [Halomicroarcula limicola]
MPTENYEKRLNETLENIQQSEVICTRNKELLQEYKRDKVLDGLSEATLLKNLTRLKVMAEHLEDQQLDEMDKGDVKDLVAWVHSEYDNEETIDTYKNVIRSFWKWLDPDEDGDAPETVAWIKLNNSTGSDKLPKDLLSKDDIEAQAEAANNPRDRALIWMLYETGARIGELIDLTVGDIEDRKHGKKVVIEGKTGARRLPLVESVPHINKWLNDHPNPTKDAPLWCKIQQGGPDDQLGYRYIRDKILRKTMKEADIDKPSNPHHYRHSRASYLANHLKEAQLCAWFGWVQGSDVPARYVHLSGRDIDNAYDEMHGLYVPEEDSDEPEIRECGRCQELNEPEAAFCMRCGYALKGESAADFEAEVEDDVKQDYAETGPEDTSTQEKIDTIDNLLDDPDVKTALLERMGTAE